MSMLTRLIGNISLYLVDKFSKRHPSVYRTWQEYQLDVFYTSLKHYEAKLSIAKDNYAWAKKYNAMTLGICRSMVLANTEMVKQLKKDIAILEHSLNELKSERQEQAAT